MADQHTNKTILGPDCKISGELALDNDAVIMGAFTGTLRVSGMLELADSSEVSGTIIVGTLRLAGKAQADVVAEDGVELLPGAELIGQVYTSRLNVIEGATFQGDVCIGPKALEAAAEALGGEQEAAPQSQQSYVPIGGQHEAEEADADDSSVKTMPSSVNAILQRRRAKVISTRNGNGATAGV